MEVTGSIMMNHVTFDWIIHGLSGCWHIFMNRQICEKRDRDSVSKCWLTQKYGYCFETPEGVDERRPGDLCMPTGNRFCLNLGQRSYPADFFKSIKTQSPLKKMLVITLFIANYRTHGSSLRHP
jgi:hypothetical protein